MVRAHHEPLHEQIGIEIIQTKRTLPLVEGILPLWKPVAQDGQVGVFAGRDGTVANHDGPLLSSLSISPREEPERLEFLSEDLNSEHFCRAQRRLVGSTVITDVNIQDVCLRYGGAGTEGRNHNTMRYGNLTA